MVQSYRLNRSIRYWPGSPWEYHYDSGGPSGDKASSIEPKSACEALRGRSEGRGEVIEADFGLRPSERTEGRAFYGAVSGKRGGDRRLSA